MKRDFKKRVYENYEDQLKKVNNQLTEVSLYRSKCISYFDLIWYSPEILLWNLFRPIKWLMNRTHLSDSHVFLSARQLVRFWNFKNCVGVTHLLIIISVPAFRIILEVQYSWKIRTKSISFIVLCLWWI